MFPILFFKQGACVQFINALVSTPDELDFRLHLRNEFLRGGLTDVLKVKHSGNLIDH